MSVGRPQLKIGSNLINLFDKEVEIRQSAEFIMEGIQIIDSMKANKVPVAIASPKVFIGAMLET
jgi:hypothetical protein